MISSRCLNTVLSGSARKSSRLSAKNHRHFSSLLSTAVPKTFQSSVNFEQGNKRTMASLTKTLTLDSINPNVIKMEYAVRGPLVIRAGEIEKEIKQGVKKPFNEVIRANIGDCHAMGQPYITFLRDVLALVVDPTNFNESKYPDDAKKRAQAILDGCGGKSVGAYSDSAGIEIIRHHAAEYIQNRDGGIPARWEDIYLCAGASQSIKAVMSLLNKKIDGQIPGVMVPIPQYPLYSATIAEFGMQQVGYYLNEDTNWGLDIPELERSLTEAKKECNPRAIVVINPGNPTGQVLTRDNIQNIIKFAHDHKLFIFADEVYQDNVYEKESTFHSFKKVLIEMGEPYKNMELASFMSCSKGYMGECGIRGGYVELINLEPTVKAMYQKSISAQLCPTTVGQAAIDVVVNPPKKGEPSYEQWYKEKITVLNSLKERAKLVADTLNSFEGFSCNTVQGAMYAFPQIKLPPKAIEAAKQAGQQPDVFYAFQLLEETGICIVAGSGFGQKPGTYHFRTTILPQLDKLKEMLSKFEKFHQKFMAKYK
ncbi:alanine aminotransferase 1 [Sitodiplosis mosellana]|uniref:alanine aminotransferase 1 n=1 Tax=Sitodiplosis mosellana TaxID=263140 RepID=UPI0024437596|nr:alanine aminotransferase 1 [Sitodiplosis mosellana]